MSSSPKRPNASPCKAINETFDFAVSWIYISQTPGAGPDLVSYIILLAVENKTSSTLVFPASVDPSIRKLKKEVGSR